MTAERLRAIREKLDRLRERDRRMEVFGAAWGDFGHKYREAPRCMEMALADLERGLGVPLPSEYRAFLANVHGGGAGPGYGLAVPSAPSPTRAFPFTRAQAMDLLERRKGDDRFAMLAREGDGPPAGVLLLADQGCGWNDVLVLVGELAGTVWSVGDGWCPHASEKGLVGLFDWYESWLDANLAPGALTNEPAEIPSLPADTEGLNLRGKSLADWPDLSRFASLRVLSLDQNRLTAIPESLGKLARLEQLSAGWNQIETLPASLGDCGALETIMLKSNMIRALPSSVGRLAALRYLCLDFNRLESLPDDIGTLGALRELLVGSNRIAALPDSIGGLGALQELDLSRNPIAQLPDSIGGLERLRSLSLSGHGLTRLPEAIARLPSLRRIALDDSKTLDVAQACDVLSRAQGLREVSLCGVGLTAAPPSLLALRTSRIVLLENPLPPAEIERIRAAMPATDVAA